ncbi:flavodoxin-dependent (E)-4-hydroxy-3-methylbut-2-enyl-diphosphate synthase [Streptomyces roseoverticillatus]|uniref:flavodoxin-dependent (E)-4-hydroxy-3-methylbut-2-enyl-diphosphate synthase n=1 Tax=Streptomyces roseoverticillatus TaxID=66429 RepID=UPI001F25B993|nr:flavodoxin-dependent (E)-4-hydroxy-3-methylbut-2-enyl-diphosphate synthase [Streptomyces roseoverticillatus]MCF3104870.1 flavodoxin-dependent (E)-4-hydroxy-3-methylbut-2-enyl-diphosphate synthase [Streptomyces roseoverticillatus]
MNTTGPGPSAEGSAAPVRRRTRLLHVGDVPVGGGAPVSVQTMTTTRTADVDATLRQIAEITAAGCDIVRVAVPTQDDADALPRIAVRSPIPVIADIHFQPRYVFTAIDAGCAGVRVNPGNIKRFDDKVKDIAKAASDAEVPIRIGVNAGSLDPRLLTTYGAATPEALVESALWECSLFEEHGFRDIKIAVKHHDPLTVVAANRLLAERCDYPLRVAVMGCVVNGPGESREAGIGVSNGNRKGQIFVRGRVVATVPENKIVEALVEQALRLADDNPPTDDAEDSRP